MSESLLEQLKIFNKKINYKNNTKYEEVLEDIELFKNMLNFENNDLIMYDWISIGDNDLQNNDKTLKFIEYKNNQIYDLNYILFLYANHYDHLTNNKKERKALKDISIKIMYKIRRFIHKNYKEL